VGLDTLYNEEKEHFQEPSVNVLRQLRANQLRANIEEFHLLDVGLLREYSQLDDQKATLKKDY
jgi:hypothetical protein